MPHGIRRYFAAMQRLFSCMNESGVSACHAHSTAQQCYCAAASIQATCTDLFACQTAGPRSYLSSPVEVMDFVVVVLSVANAASGKLLNLNMIRMVRCEHSFGHASCYAHRQGMHPPSPQSTMLQQCL